MVTRKKRYWLFKSEPDVYSIDQMEADGVEPWEGIRNYQARNFLRDEVKLGDGVLFYHSRVAPMAVVGVCEVVKEASPDETQFDPESQYYDPKSDPEDPRWYWVHIGFKEKFSRPVTLAEIKSEPRLSDMMLAQKGSRLSIQPVDVDEWKHIVKLGRSKARQA